MADPDPPTPADIDVDEDEHEALDALEDDEDIAAGEPDSDNTLSYVVGTVLLVVVLWLED